MKIDTFFAELKRCNVYKVLAYAVVGWLLSSSCNAGFSVFRNSELGVRSLCLQSWPDFPSRSSSHGRSIDAEGLKRRKMSISLRKDAGNPRLDLRGIVARRFRSD